MGNIQGDTFYLKYVIKFIYVLFQRFLNLIGYQEFLARNSIVNPLSRIMCKEKAFTRRFCIDFMEVITGKSSQLDKVRFNELDL